MTDEKLGRFQEAAAEVWYTWYNYTHAKDPVLQAHYLITLNDRVYDMATYLPGFDEKTGTLPFDD